MLALCLAGSLFARFGRGEGPPRLGALPPFSLKGHDGSLVTLESLRGHVWVADFIFTRCTDVCPAMSAAMKRLQEQTVLPIRFVSFTIDPDHDTAEVLASYARIHHAGPGWVFATGPSQEVYALASRGFRLSATPGDGKEPDEGAFIHSAKFVLVDGLGNVRGYYDSDDPVPLRRLLRDAALVSPEGAAPRRNAALNALSAVLLVMAYLFVKSGRYADHRNSMVAALISSILFLVGYLHYHAHVGSIRFPGAGPARTAYLALLASHTLLALAVVPLVLVTLTRAFRGRFELHRRIGRLTLPLWTYVSVTGVVVYWLLYRS